MTNSLSSATPAPTPANAPSLARLLGHAADAVAAVLAGRSLTEVLAAVPAAVRPGTQALAFHAMRWLGGAQAARRQLASKQPAPAVDSLLLLSLSLLWPRAEPPYAAHTLVDQAVACARRRCPAQAGFVNAVLRRFLREAEVLVPSLEASQPEARWQHPRWWIEVLQRDWPDAWPALLQADNRHPPLDLRVNARWGDAARYLAELAAVGLAGLPLGAQGVRLARPVPVPALPGFAQGWVSVQDAHAQLAAPLLLGEGADRLPRRARVLDACAAPGGKTAHLLELADLDLLALDVDASRLDRVQATLDRLGLSAQALVGDAGEPTTWWDGRLFDAILLDAPCSASGIVRRHPDVRWLRRPGDVTALARTQARLLDGLWPLLAPGGRLVYATCSVFRAEGEHQAEAFLQRRTDVVRRPAPGHLHPVADNALDHPGVGPAVGGDGFYYARFDKTA